MFSEGRSSASLIFAHVNPNTELHIHPSSLVYWKFLLTYKTTDNTQSHRSLPHDLLVRDYGTHVVTSIDVRASLYQMTFLLKSSSQTTVSLALSLLVLALSFLRVMSILKAIAVLLLIHTFLLMLD